MKILVFLLALLATCLAFAREFPAEAKRGELKSAEFPYVQIGKDVIRMAPGVKVFDEGNKIVLPTRLPQKAQIRYTLEAATGLVMNIWLLSAEEAAQK